MKKGQRQCPECFGWNTIKDGFAKNWIARKVVRTQRYRCNDCGCSFREKGDNKK